MTTTVLQFEVQTEYLDRLNDPTDGLALFVQAIQHAATELRDKADQLEGLEYVALDASAEWVAHLAEAARGARLLTFDQRQHTTKI